VYPDRMEAKNILSGSSADTSLELRSGVSLDNAEKSKLNLQALIHRKTERGNV